MKRTRLSNKLIITKIVLLVILIEIFRMMEVFNTKQLLVIVIIVGFILYQAFDLPDTITFDENFIYINRKGTNREVDLRDVTSLLRVKYSIHNKLYKIKYNYGGKQYEAKFYPRYFSKSFDKFKTAVLSKNPNIKVEIF